MRRISQKLNPGLSVVPMPIQNVTEIESIEVKNGNCK
jgi:hypothetical protein